MNIMWNAEKYAADFSFVNRYGEALLDLLDGLPAGAPVLDVGCGNGALTQQLADRGFAPTGMDASAEQLEQARRLHPDIPFIQRDALALEDEAAYDAVLANSMLHWVDDGQQDELLIRIARALKPGGWFVFEMGGAGCCARIHAAVARAFERHGQAYTMPFYFPTPAAYAARLEVAGFTVRGLWYFDRMTELSGSNGMRDWVELFDQIPFEGMDLALRDEIIAEAVHDLEHELLHDGTWYADYVRLRGVCER